MSAAVRATSDTSERLVCAVLAGQVAALRDCIDTGATVDLLWRTTDVLSQLSGLVLELSRRHPGSGPDEQCAAAVAAEADISRSLTELAFVQAQHHDFARQMADCVVTALGRLATDAPSGARLSPHDLLALYVSEDQRKVHDAVARQFAIDALSGPPQRPQSARNGR
ncbi:MAG: hypothetical protein ABSG76_24695 [Xanthobacteraceae bacterium]|jgi:hypothetical protein